MGRVILHADANCFYAGVECLYRPQYRDKPLAVCGDPEARHGIVLTKNQLAKRAGVITGEAIWQAKQKCPDLVVVEPDYPLYQHFSEMMREIYAEYTDRVEAFGLDENWLDVSAPDMDIHGGERLADELRRRVREELGITISVGVSFNKVFAKLGSDMKKPDGTTVLSEENFRARVWPLPVDALLYVGRRTAEKLCAMRIHTIGDLARADSGMLQGRMGKNGLMIQSFALGLDSSRVLPVSAQAAVKSVGNSTTLPHDIETPDDLRCVMWLLAESVGARLRAQDFSARCLSVSARTTELAVFSCQRTLSPATCITGEIARAALALFQQRFSHLLPLRSAGLTCSELTGRREPVQMDMFGEARRRARQEELEDTLDGLRDRFGHQVVRRGIVLADRRYAEINPREEHVIHPVAFLAG